MSQSEQRLAYCSLTTISHDIVVLAVDNTNAATLAFECGLWKRNLINTATRLFTQQHDALPEPIVLLLFAAFLCHPYDCTDRHDKRTFELNCSTVRRAEYARPRLFIHGTALRGKLVVVQTRGSLNYHNMLLYKTLRYVLLILLYLT
jgi:hypothetical protein